MNPDQPSTIGDFRGTTPAVKYLLFANVAIFSLEGLLRVPLSGWFALPAGWWGHVSGARLFTYMFVHANFNHLFMNMLGLFFIGPTVERTLGTKRFFMLYYLSGILGGLGWSLLAPPGSWCVGASGAVMGLLGAFGALYPNATLLLWFVLPVKAWVLTLGLILWELAATVGSLDSGIANSAHLVGAIAGFSYAWSLKTGRLPANPFRRKARSGAGETLPPGEIDRILDKIGREGIGALTPRERETLRRATR